MGNLLKPSWWISTLMTTLVTMAFIVIIKKVAEKSGVSALQNFTQEV